MIVGHSYRTTFPFALYLDETIDRAHSRVNFTNDFSFMVVRSAGEWVNAGDTKYNRYKILGPDFIGWILVVTENDREVEMTGSTNMFMHGPLSKNIENVELLEDLSFIKFSTPATRKIW